MSKQDIDVVILWVDGNDQKWQMEKNKYTNNGLSDNRDERYRDYDLLKYLFRGLEKCAPWVRKIHFVTFDQRPEWLKLHHPKLNYVNHSDFIPKEYLPTFNSHTIELNLHRIKGLSEKFIYFNDDVFILNSITEEDFFINNKVVDMLALQPVVANNDNPVMSYIYLNNALLLSRHFNKINNMKQYPFLYFNLKYPIKYLGYNFIERLFPRFTGFYTVHGPSALNKSTYNKIWHEEYDILNNTCLHKFRDKEDVSQYIIREWNKLEGNIHPTNIHRHLSYFTLDNNNQELKSVIKNRKSKFICINDADKEIDFNRIKNELNTVFMMVYPDKSSFEK